MVNKNNLAKRVAAAIIDYTLITLYAYLYIELVGRTNDEGGKTVDGLAVLVIPASWFIYFVVVEGLTGATLGHHALRLQVVRVDYSDIDISHAFKRHLLDPIDIAFFGIPSYLTIKFSERHQRVGDMWAGTIVIDKK